MGFLCTQNAVKAAGCVLFFILVHSKDESPRGKIEDMKIMKFKHNNLYLYISMIYN